MFQITNQQIPITNKSSIFGYCLLMINYRLF